MKKHQTQTDKRPPQQITHIPLQIQNSDPQKSMEEKKRKFYELRLFWNTCDLQYNFFSSLG